MRFEYVMQHGEPVFLFRVVEGSSESSFAHQVAESSGVQTDIVDRARELLEAIMNNSLPPPNKKITSKLRNVTEIIKNTLLTEHNI
nr:DNA mismatch repair protein MutS-like [Maniola hyperantus]